MKIVLASSSVARHQGLIQVGIKHLVDPSRLDEASIVHKDPIQRIVLIARAKADSISKKHSNALILAADTVGIYRNKVIEKPKFKMDALALLQSFSGTSHQIITGWSVLNSKTKKEYHGHSETRVFFNQIDTETLTNYVNDNDVTSWSAGYSPLLSKASMFIEKIEGSLTGFLFGLPLEQILPIIDQEK
jgi:septum formation protein